MHHAKRYGNNTIQTSQSFPQSRQSPLAGHTGLITTSRPGKQCHGIFIIKDPTEYQKMPYHNPMDTEPKQTESMYRQIPGKAKTELKVIKME